MQHYIFAHFNLIDCGSEEGLKKYYERNSTNKHINQQMHQIKPISVTSSKYSPN
jgi:hypothetical protein